MNFSVALKQNGAAVAATTTSAVFTVRGDECVAQFRLVASAAGSAGTTIKVTPTSLPAPRYTTLLCRGKFRYSRIAVNNLAGSVRWDGTDLLLWTASGDLGVTPSFAVASTDVLSATFSFQVA